MAAESRAAGRRKKIGAGGDAPPPVRLEALRILDAVLSQGGSSSVLLERGRFANPADRALALELVLGTLRRLAAVDFVLAKLSARPLAAIDPIVLQALRLGLYQLAWLDRIPAYAAVGETVAAAKRVAGPGAGAFVNGVLRGYLRRRSEVALPGAEDLEGYLTVTLSLPPWLARRWRERYGPEAARALGEAAVASASTTLRVVTRRSSPEAILASLADDGVTARPGRYLAESVRVDAGVVTRARAFRQGFVLVQDEAAALVARLVAPRSGDLILDAAAAPGGKAIAISDLALGRATVIAADLRPGRLKLVRANLERVRPAGVHLVAADAERPPFLAGFDRILLDAPCTGTGTIRKNPEIRYRVDGAALARSRERALAMLDRLAPLVRPGGRLVYATCSLEPEENDEVIAGFLAREPGFRRLDPRRDLPQAAHRLVGADLVLRTQPADVELDGFTAFVLEKGT